MATLTIALDVGTAKHPLIIAVALQNGQAALVTLPRVALAEPPKREHAPPDTPFDPQFEEQQCAVSQGPKVGEYLRASIDAEKERDDSKRHRPHAQVL